MKTIPPAFGMSLVGPPWNCDTFWAPALSYLPPNRNVL